MKARHAPKNNLQPDFPTKCKWYFTSEIVRFCTLW